MKIKVGDKVYSSEAQPIMVILTDKDKQNIANMLPECPNYCEYPDGMDGDEVLKWMDEVPDVDSVVRVNVQDDDGHWYYIPVHKQAEFDEYIELSGRVWGCGEKYTPEESERCSEMAEKFSPMMTGGGPIV